MSNNQSFDETIKEARQKFWKIIIHLLDKDVDINTILSVLTVNRWEIDELKSAKNDGATKVAINLAKEAHELNLTVKDIEKTTGVARPEFISYMKEGTVEINSENKKGSIAVNKTCKPKIKAKRITKLPDDYKSPLSRENERLLKLLRNL